MLDVCLISIALCAAFLTRSVETAILCYMFIGSAIATSYDLHVYLGADWYVLLALYLLIFCLFTRSWGVASCYVGMQALCMLSAWEFPTAQTFIYDNFATVMATLYLMQIGMSAYGHRVGFQSGGHSGVLPNLPENRMGFT